MGDAGMPVMCSCKTKVGKIYRRFKKSQNGCRRVHGPEYENWNDMQADEDREYPLYCAAEVAERLVNYLRQNTYEMVRHPEAKEIVENIRMKLKIIESEVEKVLGKAIGGAA